MLLRSEQDVAANGHDSFDANSLVMVTLRQASSMPQIGIHRSEDSRHTVISTEPDGETSIHYQARNPSLRHVVSARS